MTIGTRYNDYSVDRPALAFGVEWNMNSSSPTLTRLDDAENLEVNTTPNSSLYALHSSEFDNFMPWKGMKRVVLNHTGDIMTMHGEVDGAGTTTFDESTAGFKKVMVSIPKFWYRISRNTPVANAWSFWVSPYPLEGYRIHPAFVRGVSGATANVLDVIYVGAYEAYIDATNATWPSLYSVANVTPGVSKTRAQFRSYATNMGSDCTRAGPVNIYNYGLMDWQTWNALQLLYLVEYASFDSLTPSGSSTKGGLSKGITNGAQVEKTGWTSSVDVNANGYHSRDMGNGSGQVKCNVNGGAAVNAMTYRGIENVWGNTHTMLDAININSVDRRIWINYTGSDVADQANADMTWPYVASTYVANSATGNPKYLTGWASYQDDNWMFEKFTMGGATNTYMCSTYTVGGWAAASYPRVGGNYSQGGGSGMFCTDLTFAYATTNSSTGARLQYIPSDSTFYTY